MADLSVSSNMPNISSISSKEFASSNTNNVDSDFSFLQAAKEILNGNTIQTKVAPETISASAIDFRSSKTEIESGGKTIEESMKEHLDEMLNKITSYLESREQNNR